MKKLETDRYFELARSHTEKGKEPRIEVSILKLRPTHAKVGHDPEIEPLENGALEDEAHAPQIEAARLPEAEAGSPGRRTGC